MLSCFRLSGETDTENVHLRGDSHSASVTELWQATHPTSSRPDPQINNIASVGTSYHPLSGVHQSLNGSVRNGERIKPQYQRELGGEWIVFSMTVYLPMTSLLFVECAFYCIQVGFYFVKGGKHIPYIASFLSLKFFRRPFPTKIKHTKYFL